MPWSREACELWQRFLGVPPGGRIGKALKPLVGAHGWSAVRPLWRDYLEQAVTEDDPKWASPQAFAATFTARFRKARPQARAEEPPPPDVSAAPALAGEFLTWQQRHGDGETQGQALVRWLRVMGIPFGKPLQVAISLHVGRLVAAEVNA